MITDLKNVFQELLGNVSRFLYIGGPTAAALRRRDDGTIKNKGIDITNGNGSGGENSTDWLYSFLRAANSSEASELVSPNFDYTADGKGDQNNAVTLFDLMGRIADIEFSVDGDEAAAAGYINKFGIIHTNGSNFDAGTVVYCRQTDVSTYEWIEINKDICKAILTRSAVTGTLTLDAHWLYEWDGSVWRKKCDSAAATPGVRVIKENFNYNSGTTAGTAATIPVGATILRVETIITTAFNGSGNSSIRVNGGGINSLMPTTANYPNVAGLYVTDHTSSTTHKAVATSDTGVTVTVVQGSASQGAGYTLVHFVEAEE